MASPIPTVVLSRTSGRLPLGVYFDASGTTDADTSFPFHDLFYLWNFGDGSGETWSRGAIPSYLKNQALGPEAAHVYESAGVKAWSMLCFDGTTAVITTGEITVTDWPNDENTVCVGNVLPVAGVNGAPSNATCVQSSDFDAAILAHMGTDKRIMFQRGDTFDAATPGLITSNGPGYITAFGVGSNPIIRATTPTTGNNIINVSSGAGPISDWRISDLVLDGLQGEESIGINSPGSYSQLTVLRVTAGDVKYGFSADVNALNNLNDVGTTTISGTEAAGQTVLTVASAAGMATGQAISIALSGGLDNQVSEITGISGSDITIANALTANSQNNAAVQFWSLPFSPENPLWDQVFIHDFEVNGLVGGDSSGANAIFMSGSRVSIQGCLLDTLGLGEHGLRAMRLDRSVISHNEVKNIASSKTCYTLRSLNFAGSPTLAAGSYSEKLVFSYNKASDGGAQAGVGPNNDTSSGRWRNAIFQCNWFCAGTDSADVFTIQSATQITYRNNLTDLSGSTAGGARSLFIKNDVTNGVTPADVWIYNNTFYRGDAGTATYRPINVQTGITSNIKIINNLAYAPLTTSPVMVTLQGTASATASNNSTDAQITGTNPQFASATPTTPADFRISTASYAADGGTAQFPAQNSDFFGGLDKTGDNRIGALVPRATMQVSGVPQ